ALDGVYKLSRAGEKDRLKTSETFSKTTLPGVKSVSRFYDREGLLAADAIHLSDEKAPERMIHPFESDRRLELKGFSSCPLLEPVFRDGLRTKERTPVSTARSHLQEAIKALPPEYQRFENPHTYKVGLSPGLWKHRSDLMNAKQKDIES
ncbi:MAG: hypothetical protein R6V45_10865, partial [Oceanipulchritudo sp.]